MAQQPGDSVISLEYRGRVAVITIDNDSKLNALTQPQYYDLARKLHLVSTRDDVFVTVILAKGRYFSAGADVSISRAASDSPDDSHRLWLTTFAAFNLNITHAFATHPKILVVGLNGPVIGLSAALISFADFIYAVPHAFLLTPFSSIGLVAEGGASRAMVHRLGPARANEALIMSKRLTARELETCGFVNQIFPFDKGDDAAFRAKVLHEVDERLGDHLNGESMLGIKKLIRGPEMNLIHSQNVHEVFAGIDRFVKGIPQEEFRKLASGEKRHKL
ncbi:enoyl-CoA hydratase/isomerase domain-containing protein [Hirsutella rhossiliensis]|uniref:Enoyl-CoA hydratase/isomerase domain-containing protein n=1 Tax=Hirsutella rhossiliensis TaxID=111463 RepID=A0A9P8SEM3_9HYPO|nr:enoyl-CoA hydratase/isomerase domain-containing protein [Hirsutella rhossiliensis]KAH0959149.1 enoyl-CoA hydratase/isomerase domain-containing protein [Hirsutella rhossiliensis]